MWIIIIDNHLLYCIYIRIYPMFTSINSPKTSLSYHLQLFVIDFIASSWVGKFRHVVFKWLMHNILIISLFVLAVEDLEYYILINLFLYFFLRLFFFYILLTVEILWIANWIYGTFFISLFNLKIHLIIDWFSSIE